MLSFFLNNMLKRDNLNNINEIDEKTLFYLRKHANNVILVDVRSKQEYNEGHMPGAILLQSFEARQKAEIILKNKNDIIVLYCSTGMRSKKVAKILKEKGYKNVNVLEQ